MARSRLVLALSVLALAGCAAWTSQDYWCGHGRCIRKDGFAFIDQQNRVPGSSASQGALARCEEEVDPKVRLLAGGHREARWAASPWIYGEGAALWCIVTLCPLFAGLPASLELERTWSREEAAARDRMAREVGQCMGPQGLLLF